MGVEPTLSPGNPKPIISSANQPEDTVIGNHSTYKEIIWMLEQNNFFLTLCAHSNDQNVMELTQDMPNIGEDFSPGTIARPSWNDQDKDWRSQTA